MLLCSVAFYSTKTLNLPWAFLRCGYCLIEPGGDEKLTLFGSDGGSFASGEALKFFA